MNQSIDRKSSDTTVQPEHLWVRYAQQGAVDKMHELSKTYPHLDALAQDEEGINALSQSIVWDQPQSMALLLAQLDPVHQDVQIPVAFEQAVKYSALECLQLLLEQYDPRHRYRQMQHNLLHIAVQEEALLPLELLLADGRLDANALNAKDYTPMVLALKDGNERLVHSLLPHSNLAVTDRRGRTALHAAAIWGEHQILEYLLQHDSSSAMRLDEQGNNILHYGAMMVEPQMVQVALKYCDPSVPNKQGVKPYELCAHKNESTPRQSVDNEQCVNECQALIQKALIEQRLAQGETNGQELARVRAPKGL